MNASSSPDPIIQEEMILSAAIQLRDVAERTAYLNLACDGNLALRARVENMLAADGDSFFEGPTQRLASAGYDHKVRIWDARKGYAAERE